MRAFWCQLRASYLLGTKSASYVSLRYLAPGFPAVTQGGQSATNAEWLKNWLVTRDSATAVSAARLR